MRRALTAFLFAVVCVVASGCDLIWVPEFQPSSTDGGKPRVTCIDGVQRVQLTIGNAYEDWNEELYDLRLTSLTRTSGGGTVTLISTGITIAPPPDPTGDPEADGVNWAGYTDSHPYTSTATVTYALTWEWRTAGTSTVVAGPFSGTYQLTLPGCPGGIW